MYFASRETPAKCEELLLYCQRIFRRYKPGTLVTPFFCFKGLKLGMDIIEKSLSYPVAHIILETFLVISILKGPMEVRLGCFSKAFAFTPTGLPLVYQIISFPNREFLGT